MPCWEDVYKRQLPHRVHDVVSRHVVEHHRKVSRVQAEVEQCDAVAEFRHGRGEIRGHDRLAKTAPGGNHRDDKRLPLNAGGGAVLIEPFLSLIHI